ncbi:3-hydroxy-2-methylbutyryl-CoA dehydrogenase [Rhodococcus rhodochrous KG-21]|uniref:3-hydroxy-2-methylbutyryl-CoA dehydrogenase n=1 Tax=Rhodococcus rhodochrous KG-21 TaxID=1441923 RepID=A0A0M8PP82_RHORH|nr:SDR family oxidoreductase [Rhodococcus rhodochrous]KOS56732.1 3-hydroxy-2-methylbutyryl-CoA dehydrogenase [Rhodococcus rhodochrous KG-21]
MTGTDNAVTIVTGGAGGLGEAVVRKLSSAGAAVVIADLADSRAEALADELGNKVVYARTDVTDEASVNAAIHAASELGTLRFAVICHGGWGVAEKVVNRDGTPAALDGFTKTLDLYLTGSYNVLRLASARMATNEAGADGERGAVVMTASIAGYEGQIGQTAYAAAKAGVIGLTLAGARDLSSVGVRLNTIAPGTMHTAMMESVGDEALQKFTANVPFPKRLGRPEEFADLALQLLENGYLNGEVVRLDGAQRFGPR